jgi:hypothetical protein
MGRTLGAALGSQGGAYDVQGGYEPGNVYIGTAADNARDRMVVAKWNAYWHAWSVREKLNSLN